MGEDLDFGKLLGSIEATLHAMQATLNGHFSDEAEQNKKIDCIVGKIGDLSHQLSLITASSMDQDSQRILHLVIDDKRQALQRRQGVADTLVRMAAGAGLLWVLGRLWPGSEKWFQ